MAFQIDGYLVMQKTLKEGFSNLHLVTTIFLGVIVTIYMFYFICKIRAGK